MAEGGRPSGTSMTRFSTMPSSVTMTTRARPGPRLTNSRYLSGRSCLGATTSPAQCDRPGLSHCAGLVVAPKQDRPLKYLEFVNLGPGRALVVIVTEDGMVENRVIEVPLGLPPSAMVAASNYLNARLVGRTMDEARAEIEEEVRSNKAQLDELTSKLVANGLASWAGGEAGSALIVRGQANLLEDVTALADLERLRALFEMLETRETMLRLLDASRQGEGVQIFIGAESHLFGVAGCAMIIAPYQNSREQIVGAIGVIGPTRINYARIIPMVDYTAKMIGRLIG